MSIAKNYIFNLVYQITILILPLITVPYIARVLGPHGVGVNVFTNSIVQYFILFGTIGIAIYGNRTIAYVRDDKEKLSRAFWGIFFLKLVTVCISYLCFLIFLNIIHQYHTIYLLQSILIVSAAVDVTWLYMGLEDFKKTVLRNLIVRLIGMCSVFIFVKEPSDLWKYVLILSVSEFFGQLTMWAYVPKTIRWVHLNWNDLGMHFMPSIQLFIPQIAIQVYVVLNKTMLGTLTSKSEVAFFDNSDKIVRMVLAIVTAMGVVMLPRVANTFARGEIERVKEYLYQSFNFSSYLSIPMAFGLAGIANKFAPWFFGPDYIKTGTIIFLISPIIIFIAWSNVLGQQYLLPTGQTRAYTLSVTVGAVVNLILNLILIGKYRSIGTAFSTVAAEFFVTLVQILYMKDNLSIGKMFKSVWKYFVSALIMFLVIKLIVLLPINGLSLIVTQIGVGIIVYLLSLFVLRAEMNEKLFNKGWKLFKKILR